MESPRVLNSWKEIAAYLGRGVRTVQRWERELGMPVHRPRGKDRSAVLAISAELDRWLAATPIRAAAAVNGGGLRHTIDIDAVRDKNRVLRDRLAQTMQANYENIVALNQRTRRLTDTLNKPRARSA
jgi:DNA-binding transcriptional regulator YiaG